MEGLALLHVYWCLGLATRACSKEGGKPNMLKCEFRAGPRKIRKVPPNQVWNLRGLQNKGFRVRGAQLSQRSIGAFTPRQLARFGFRREE